MRIGVFDSGVGGKAVAEKLAELLPDAEIVSIDDHEHVPYGTRPNEEIIALTDAAIQPLLDNSCDAIVIACNTATTIAIRHLRAKYPSTSFIGIEPMVKSAASMTKTGKIAVLATPSTLQSERYQELKQTWAKNTTVIEPDCSAWASMIESGSSDAIDIYSVVNPLIESGVDVIVLGCTHYHLIKKRVVETAGNVAVILEPTDAIANRISSLVK
ncbi:glutamate racemase [soil metagenome]